MGVHRSRPRLTYGVCAAANQTTGDAEARGRRTLCSRRAASELSAPRYAFNIHEAKKLDLLDALSDCSPTHAALHEATEADRDTVVPDLLLEYVKVVDALAAYGQRRIGC